MLTLYHSTFSRGLRALWTIEEMGLDCEIKLLPYPPRLTTPEFFQINPLGTIPYLIDGEERISESSAIAEYLVGRYGPTPLAVLPEEADYGYYMNYLHFSEASLAAAVANGIRYKMVVPELNLQAVAEDQAGLFVDRIALIEARLEGREFLCAGRLTTADIVVAYSLFLARISGNGALITPRAASYLDRLLARPAFIRASAREKAVTS